MATLSVIPIDVMKNIFDMLDVRTQLTMRQMCKLYYNTFAITCIDIDIGKYMTDNALLCLEPTGILNINGNCKITSIGFKSLTQLSELYASGTAIYDEILEKLPLLQKLGLKDNYIIKLEMGCYLQPFSLIFIISYIYL